MRRSRESVFFDESPVDSLSFKKAAQSRCVSALGKPKSARHATKGLYVLANPGSYLCLNRFGNSHVQWEEAVCRRARSELEVTTVTEIGKSFDQVALPFIHKKRTETKKAIFIHFSELAETGDVASLDFIATELQGAVKVGEGSSLERAITHHRKKRRRQVESQMKRDFLASEPEQHFQ